MPPNWLWDESCATLGLPMRAVRSCMATPNSGGEAESMSEVQERLLGPTPTRGE